VVAPLRSSKGNDPFGLLVGGVGSRLQFDEQYKSFYELAANAIATAIVKARAYEDECKRAEALAEIDRVKTAFFSNVSHEFRTPLTLMLGPLEELKHELSRAPEFQWGRPDLIQRNGLRLLRLVNTLLDFSRIKAGRIQAAYEPVDLSTFTAELASVFRAAVEKAGLRLDIDCPPMSEPAYVDREMWEKIVLNLVSNAFKFTFEGAIEVKLREAGAQFELIVRDTGAGIPAEELPRIFERFHRVPGVPGRTHEGSGIGLALVQELVRRHGGTVAAESAHGKGATIRVAVPRGTSHLTPAQVRSAGTRTPSAIGAQPYLEEALRWLLDSRPDDEPVLESAPTGRRPKQSQ
jgi:signal transduction histidine kinase